MERHPNQLTAGARAAPPAPSPQANSTPVSTKIDMIAMVFDHRQPLIASPATVSDSVKQDDDR